MELKARGELDPAYQWDFTHIFPDDAAWEAAMAHAAAGVETVRALRGTLGRSTESLKAGLDAVYQAAERLETCCIYAMLHKSADGGDAAYQEMNARAEDLSNAFSSAAAFLSPELLAIDPATLDAWMALPALGTYRHMVEDVCRARAHTLDAATEELLANLGRASAAPSDAFNMFQAVDLTYPPVVDEHGQEVPLTNGSFGVFRVSPDRRVRREAFEKYFGAFEQFRNTLAALYAGSVKFDNFSARTRHYAGACEASLFQSNVPVSVYDSLVAAVHDGLPAMKRYLALRQQRLGLSELHLYDLYCPIVEDVAYPMPFADTKELVKKALAPLGEAYGKLLDRAYAERWMDVYENKGKDSGAFSCGVYGVHPYVLLNYTDTLEDAFTVAHELGHAMHSHFSEESNDYVNAGYALLVAEVASTVNEVLLSKYLLATETDPRRRAYVLNRFLEGFRTTLYRQTLFAEFERTAHEMDAAGKPLTAASLSRVYHELNALYYDGAVIDPCTDIEWARIPHFYRAFYVYQYATGFSSAVAIASRILETGDAGDYLRFLTTGGSDYPLEELKLAGVDLTKPDAVRNALSVFADCVAELEALTASL